MPFLLLQVGDIFEKLNNHALKGVKLKKFEGLIAFVLLYVTLFLPAAFAGERITLFIDEWPPYTSEMHPDRRLLQNIVTEVCDNINVKADYKYLPWKRCYEYVKSGNDSGTFPWVKTPEREKNLL